MTDEEMAEEWVKENMDCCRTDNSVNQPIPYFSEEERCVAKSAFLAGLKARLQWHYVKDGLPTNTGLYLIFYYNSFFNDKVRCIARYSPDRKKFFNLNIEDGDEVIAWQELPAPPKEIE